MTVTIRPMRRGAVVGFVAVMAAVAALLLFRDGAREPEPNPRPIPALPRTEGAAPIPVPSPGPASPAAGEEEGMEVMDEAWLEAHPVAVVVRVLQS
jgi:hypothetical protein